MSDTARVLGRLAFTVAGALIGATIAGPAGATFGASIGGALGAAAGFLLLPPRGIDLFSEGPRLADLSVTSSAPGQPIVSLHGTLRMGGNVIWSPGITEIRSEETIEQGKGGGSSQTLVSYRYTADFAQGFCEGLADIIQIFADGKLVADWTGAGPTTSAATSGAITRYQGTETQTPSSVIQADKGVADTPAYRGLCYVVFDDLPLEDYGNRIPQITAVVSTNATASAPTATLSPGVGMGRAVWRPGREIFYSISTAGGAPYTVNVVHSPSQTLIISGELVEDVFGDGRPRMPGIDNESHFYWSEQEVTSTSTIAKYDSDTFAVLGQTIVSGSTGAVPLNRSLIIMGKAPTAQKIVHLNTGDKITIIDTRPLGGTDNGRGRPILPVLESIALNTLYGGAWNCKDAAIDSDGFCWVLATEAGSPTSGARVTKIEPGIGAIVESHTISGRENAEHIAHEPSTDTLLIGSPIDKEIIRWDPSTQTIEAISSGIASYPDVLNRPTFRAGVIGGSLWLGRSQTIFYEIDALDLTIKRTLSSSTWGVGNMTDILYDPISHAIIRHGAAPSALDDYWLFLDRLSGAGVTLQSIVEDISAQVGLTDIDASELTDTVHGFAITSRMTARRAIESLMPAFFFDAIESDWVMKFPKRGQSVVAALTEDDLGARTNPNEIVPFITETRQQEVELPLRIEVSYPDPSIDYQRNTQSAERTAEAVDTVQLVSVELPIAFADNDEPAQIAEKLLYLAWQNRTQYSIATILKHSRLDPADVITANSDGVTHTILLGEPTRGTDGIIQARGVSEDAAIYVSTAIGQDADDVPAQSIVIAGAFAFQLVDTPLMRDQDDGQILYIAAGPFGTDTFPGAVVYRSTDNVEFTDAVAFISGSTSIGATSTLLASGTYTVFDRVNTVTLRLFSGTLSSSTEAAILTDESTNAILIGDELLQFVTATLNADGTYTLSTLLRGRRGTEWAVGAHAAVERVVVPATTMIRYAADIADLNVTRYYRGIPIGGSPVNAVNRSLAWTGASLKPYAPVHIKGSRGGSPADWTIRWLRRTRVNGAWKDFVDVPYGEAIESFEVDIMDGATVKRKITTTDSGAGSIVDVDNLQATYSDADQVTDWGSTQNSIVVNIYQLGSVVGRGYVGTATITL